MSHPYACRIEVRFPKNEDAEQAVQGLQVDREPGDRVVKSFSVVKDDADAVAIMRV